MSLNKEAVLGISAFGHDTAACLVAKNTGEVLYAVAEERLTNVKHDSRFPVGAIKQCQEVAKQLEVSITDVGVNFNDVEFMSGTLTSEIRFLLEGKAPCDALIKKIHDVYTINDYYFEGTIAKRVIDGEIERLPCDRKTKDVLARRIQHYFNWGIKYRHIFHSVRDMFPGIQVHQINHHLTHAASAFLNSGFRDAAVLVIDGQGESETVTIYQGDDNGLKKISSSIWPNSLGIFYLNATNYLGFKLGDEYKVMGMAAYGKPRFYDTLSEMMEVTENGQIFCRETPYFAKQDMGTSGHVYFNFTKQFRKLVKPRAAHEEISQEHFDFAASVQKFTEDMGVEIAKRAIKLTKSSNIAIAGGVGLNGLMNEKIRRLSGCSDIFVYPAAGDDGTAVGAAQYLAFQQSKFPRRKINTCYYGYVPLDGEIKNALKEKKINFSEPASIHASIAQALSEGKIVARYFGGAEFGPRALGHRSIMANPRDANMKDTLNVRIKHREPFRPFAPVCLRDKVSEYFELDVDAPFMLLICQAKERAKKEIPAVVHNDGTARVQTVTQEQNSDLFGIISAFEKVTGTPVIINTSFNVNGETIVDTPIDAIESFGYMDIDYLAIGDCWVAKDENRDKFPKLSSDAYLEIRRSRFAETYSDSMSILDISYSNYFFEPGLTNFLLRHIKSKIKKSSIVYRMLHSMRAMLPT